MSMRDMGSSIASWRWRSAMSSRNAATFSKVDRRPRRIAWRCALSSESNIVERSWAAKMRLSWAAIQSTAGCRRRPLRAPRPQPRSDAQYRADPKELARNIEGIDLASSIAENDASPDCCARDDLVVVRRLVTLRIDARVFREAAVAPSSEGHGRSSRVRGESDRVRQARAGWSRTDGSLGSVDAMTPRLDGNLCCGNSGRTLKGYP